jgi:hypothetical protein
MGVAGLCGERALARWPQGRLQPRSPSRNLGAWEDNDQRRDGRQTPAMKGV